MHKIKEKKVNKVFEIETQDMTNLKKKNFKNTYKRVICRQFTYVRCAI